VLNNELYIGRYIWNRSQWVKDPDSHKRVRVERPRNEWHIVERPDLRIVTDELWQAARARIGTREPAPAPVAVSRTVRVLSAVLREVYLVV